ncbi:MAG: hypothetical protein J6C85_03360 [Alphaproteobacteria bacterium]|nr:hypothetical protein [Alphaproteobacteria bacterium]
MEKDYVKDALKTFAFLGVIEVFYLAAWLYAQFISEKVIPPFMTYIGYVLAGGATGMLLGNLYGWLYLKERKLTILAVISVLTVCLYFGHGLLIKSLVGIAYPVGLFFLIFLFVATSSIFRSSIKQDRDYEQRWEELEKKFEQGREERIRKAVEDALVKHITKKVVDRVKQSR